MTIASLLLGLAVRAQTVQDAFIYTVASGGNNTTVSLGGQQVNVNWTVGQAVIDPMTPLGDPHTIGFNQGFLCNWGWCVTSVEELTTTLGSNLRVFPNPAVDVLNIEFSGIWLTGAVAQITDLSGCVITVLGLNSAQSRIDIGHLSIGMYIINLLAPDGRTLSSHRIIRQ